MLFLDLPVPFIGSPLLPIFLYPEKTGSNSNRPLLCARWKQMYKPATRPVTKASKFEVFLYIYTKNGGEGVKRKIWQRCNQRTVALGKHDVITYPWSPWKQRFPSDQARQKILYKYEKCIAKHIDGTECRLIKRGAYIQCLKIYTLRLK